MVAWSMLDPLLPAVVSGEVLTRGSRLGTHGRQRVRGQVLDLLHPWRVETVERAVRPDEEAVTRLSNEVAWDGCKPDCGCGAKGGTGCGIFRLEREVAGREH